MSFSIDFNEATLLDGLSSFWTRLFADRDVLKTLYAGTEEVLGQAYQDLLLSVVRMSIGDIPLLRKEYWTQLLLRRDQIRHDASHAYPYAHDVPEGLADAFLIFNKITAPSAEKERDIDFVLDAEAGEVRFLEDPFSAASWAAYPVREINITPTVYASGSYGVYDTTGPTPKRLTVSGIVATGTQGRATGTAIFQDLNAQFSADDVGRTLEVNHGAGITRTIIQVLDAATVVADSTLGASFSGVSWRVIEEDMFSSYDVGSQIILYDPAVSGESQLLTIASVVTIGSSTRTVEFQEDITLTTTSTLSARWTHQSTARTPQLAAWIPDAGFDREDLYYAFGCLVNRRERSTEGYRALLQGIFQLYMLGPALERIEAALNTFVGVPVAHEDGEEVISVDTTQPEFELVVTTYGEYELPKGSLAPKIVVGYTLQSFEALTTLFTVHDSVSNPTWFHGKEIPLDLISDASVPDRNIDPQLYPLTIGSAKPWYIGGPRIILGADDTGQIVPVRSGADGFHDTADVTYFLPFSKAFVLEDIGSTLTVEGVDYTILDVGLDSTFTGHTWADIGTDVTALQAGLVGAGQLPLTGHQIFDWTGASPRFSSGDVGRHMFLTASSDAAFVNTQWRITEVISTTRVRVEPLTPGFSGGYVAGTTFTAKLALRWRLETRPPLRHNIGYNLMRDYIQQNVLYVQYDLGSYPDLPSLRTDDDIRQVILATKPAHTYLYLEGTLYTTDQVRVTSDVDWVIQPEKLLVQEDPLLTIGSAWSIGDVMYYTGSQTAWVDVAIRDNQMSAGIYPFKGTDQADTLWLQTDIQGDPTAKMTVTFYHDPGTGWTPTGTSVVIDPSVSNLVSLPTNGLVLGASATVSGSPTQSTLIYGLNTNEPDLLEINEGSAATSSAASVTGDTLTDLTFSFMFMDRFREIYLTLGGVETVFRIRNILSPTSVQLWDASNTPATLAVAAGVTWRAGFSHLTGTPVVIGGANPYVQRTGSSEPQHVVDWPAMVQWQP